MNWNQVEGEWKNIKGKVREKWGKLTDDELDVAAGKKDQIIGKLQQHYGLARDKAEDQLDRFIADLTPKSSKH